MDWPGQAPRAESMLILEGLQQHIFSSEYAPDVVFMTLKSDSRAVRIEFVIEKITLTLAD